MKAAVPAVRGKERIPSPTYGHGGVKEMDDWASCPRRCPRIHFYQMYDCVHVAQLPMRCQWTRMHVHVLPADNLYEDSKMEESDDNPDDDHNSQRL